MVPLLDGWRFVRMHCSRGTNAIRDRRFRATRGRAQCNLKGLIKRTSWWSDRLVAFARRASTEQSPPGVVGILPDAKSRPLIPRLGAGGLGSTNLRPGSFLVVDRSKRTIQGSKGPMDI